MPMTARDEESFLGRWSRRKRAGEPEPAGQPAPARPEPPVGEAAEDEAEAARRQANRAAAEAIDIDAIDYDSDLSDFFKDGVPAALKQAALRKMWTSNPVFANLDGLNDYDHDYNVIDTILTKFQSAWQVGRGYRTEEEEAPSGDETPESSQQAEAADADPAASDPSPRQADEPAGNVRLPQGRPFPAPAGPLPSQAGDDAAQPEPAAMADGSGEEQQAVPARPQVSLRRRRAMFEE